MIIVEMVESDEDGKEKVPGVRGGATVIRRDSIYTNLG
jgi:hypothetical protein